MATEEAAQQSAENARIEALLSSGEAIAPPERTIHEAHVKDYEDLYQRSIRNIPAFWEEIAKELEWFAPWSTVLDWQYPHHKWFVGAKCNITHNCLDRHVRAGNGGRQALIWLGEDGEEQIYTFAELLAYTNRVANALKSLGVGKGDRVCLYMPLTPEALATMLGCARVGAIHSIIYAGLGAGSLRSRLDDAQAKVLVMTDAGYRRGKVVNLKAIADEAVEGLDYLQHIVVHRRRGETQLDPQRHVEFHELVDRQSTECAPEIMDSEDPLFLLYTSGTTGRPKGPVYVHGGYNVGTYYMTKIAYDLHPDDIWWCMSDIGWIVGHSSMVYGPWANGVTNVVREGAPDYPHPGIVWELMDRYGVTKFHAAPTTIRMWMRMGKEHIEPYDLSTVKLALCAGEPLNPEAYQWAYRYISRGRFPILDNWWQTETAMANIGTLPVLPAKPGWVGKPMPGVIAEVVNRNGEPIPPHTGGFLTLQGPWPHLMRTIWQDDERYQSYWNTMPNRYFAGDVAVRDEDGYISVLGRADDVVNVAGHRIATADVESALVSHPAVAEAGVIGKPDALKGEAIKAFVTLRTGYEWSDALSAELVEHVRHVLGGLATPAELEYAPKLPKTRSGKIMRRVLKARELGIDPGDITTIEE
jgi:acetyl-CoA synthetase